MSCVAGNVSEVSKAEEFLQMREKERNDKIVSRQETNIVIEQRERAKEQMGEHITKMATECVERNVESEKIPFDEGKETDRIKVCW